MILKGIINEEVSYMIVPRKDIGKYSLHITRNSKECKIMQIGKMPSEKEYMEFDSTYRKEARMLIEDCLINRELNFDVHSLFILVCGTMDEDIPIQQVESVEDIGEFAWKRPIMRGTKTGREIMEETIRKKYLIHPKIQRKKRSFIEVLYDRICGKEI